MVSAAELCVVHDQVIQSGRKSFQVGIVLSLQLLYKLIIASASHHPSSLDQSYHSHKGPISSGGAMMGPHLLLLPMPSLRLLVLFA